MRFVTLFLETENVHLLKDVGMIPYHLYKDHNMDCTIVTYKNSEKYTYLENEVKGLKLQFIKKSPFGAIIDGVNYLNRNASDIDILNIYHLNLSSFFYSIVYRHRNKNGKIYLKLDMNPIGLVNLYKKDLRGAVKRMTMRMCTLASVETTKMRNRLVKTYGDKIIYIPNGCYSASDFSKEKKENIILTVGNLGTFEKATDVLLNAFAEYVKNNKDSDWKLHLVGSVAEDFREKIDSFYKENEYLKDRVLFLGPIYDKKELNREYSKAKVFTLPSLSESFGIVLVEAAMNGCYIIASDMVPAAFDITDGFKYGKCVKAGDISSLATAFDEVCNDSVDYKAIATKTAAHVRTAFNQTFITDRLYRKLIEK